ncbi:MULTISPECIES: Cys-tRNA(Pro) deacylase [unclassified Corynebacterium]|uniref:Cys-tRNA(Pro) deacylase n=1 Tax=unclassified Corynebacterium TaxID=2624378 RepID=UPI001C443E3F|nr:MULTISPECIES: Cys-tRNA(Pro) deacylase [unclassified Corynebacterium]MBV7282751.1 Cys-tRNA(Pro) deacylase [Corynebacterium sp. TAE3-ERU30]MBV7302862.1 Cys-tRNA(Pro) deacylase [Corynebacterium sp. TAE3-ERU2]
MAKKKKKGAAGAATPALAMLRAAGIEHQVHEFDAGHDHFGQQAAAALGESEGVAAAAIFKTLVVDLSAGRGPRRSLAVCCVPVTGSLSLKKAAHAFGVSKVSMADPHDAEKSSGYITGGISPLGQKKLLPTRIDASATAHPTIYVSGGKRGLDIQLRASDMAAVLGAEFSDLAAP